MKLQAATLIAVLLISNPATPVEIDALRWIDLAVPEEALAVGRIDVGATLASPIGQYLREARKETYQTADTFFDDAFGVRMTDLDYFWYAFPVPGVDGGISLLQGPFNVDRVKHHMLRMEGWQSYRSKGVLHVSSFRNAAGRREMAALLREDLIAIGSLDPMRSLLKQWRKAGGDDIRSGIIQVGTSDATVAAAYVDMEVFKGTNPAYALVDSAFMEGRVGDDVDMTFYAESSSPDIAEGLVSVALGLVKSLSSREGLARQPVTLQMMENVKVTREDTTILIKTMVTGDSMMTQFNRPVRRNSASE